MAVNQPSFLPSNKIYASKITIFLPKVKSDLGKIFFKFLHAGNYFSLLYRSLSKPTNSVSKKHIPPAWRDLKIFFLDHFQIKNCNFKYIFHFEGENNGCITAILCVVSSKNNIGNEWYLN